MVGQFFIIGPTQEVEAKHFKGAFCGFAARPQGYKQAGNEGTVYLDSKSVFRMRQEVTTAYFTLYPL